MDKLPPWIKGCIKGMLYGGITAVIILVLYIPLHIFIAIFGGSPFLFVVKYAPLMFGSGAFVGGFIGMIVGYISGRSKFDSKKFPGWLNGLLFIDYYFVFIFILSQDDPRVSETNPVPILIFTSILGALVGFIFTLLRKGLSRMKSKTII